MCTCDHSAIFLLNQSTHFPLLSLNSMVRVLINFVTSNFWIPSSFLLFSFSCPLRHFFCLISSRISCWSIKISEDVHEDSWLYCYHCLIHFWDFCLLAFLLLKCFLFNSVLHILAENFWGFFGYFSVAESCFLTVILTNRGKSTLNPFEYILLKLASSLFSLHS